MKSQSKSQQILWISNILILKCIWRGKGSIITNMILKKKNNFQILILLNFKIYYKAIVIKTVWYWWKNSHIDQWNIIESPEMDPCKFSQLIFDKKKQHRATKIVFFSKWHCNNWTTTSNESRHRSYTLYKKQLENRSHGIYLVVQWLGLCFHWGGGAGLIHGQGTKIPHAA